MMALAIIFGIVVGAVGFIPLVIALKLTRKAIGAGIGPNVAIVLLCLFVSLGFYIAMIFIFNDMNHDYIVPFVVSTALMLSVTAIGYGIYTQVKR